MTKPTKARAFTALAAAGSLWGTGFLFGKWALAELSVGQMVFYRFLFASIGFAPAVVRGLSRPASRIPRRDIPLIFICALVGVPIQFIIQFEGLAHTTVSHASLMVGGLPVLLAAGSALFAHERVAVSRWVALVASTIGAALIALGASTGEGGSHATVLGDLLVAASLIAAVVWILITQRLMRSGRYTPVTASAYVMTLGAILLAIWVVISEGAPPIDLHLKTWASVAAMGLFATTVTTYLWNWGLSYVPASQAGVFINLEPVIGAMLGVIIFADILGPYALLGGALVVGSAVYVALSENHPEDRSLERAIA